MSCAPGRHDAGLPTYARCHEWSHIGLKETVSVLHSIAFIDIPPIDCRKNFSLCSAYSNQALHALVSAGGVRRPRVFSSVFFEFLLRETSSSCKHHVFLFNSKVLRKTITEETPGMESSFSIVVVIAIIVVVMIFGGYFFQGNNRNPTIQEQQEAENAGKETNHTEANQPHGSSQKFCNADDDC